MSKTNDNINVSIFTALKVSEVSKVPVFFIGCPGCGKTTGTEMFAQVRGYDVIMLRGNSESPETIAGFQTVPSDVQRGEKVPTNLTRPYWFEQILDNEKRGQKSLLFIDEITTATEFVQSALLHIIQDRQVGDEYLPDSTLIVVAGNYAGNLSSSMTVLPPLMNRHMIFNIEPDHTDLETFLSRYKGASLSKTGEGKDVMAELRNKMAEIDKQELDPAYFNSIKGKVSELIETTILETTRMIMTTNGCKHDMGIKDLSSVYTANIDDDSKLFGYITMRSLVFLTEVAIASYRCFGKSGLTSNNFRNMIDGLCGVGVSRDKKTGDVMINQLGAEYYSALCLTANELEKLQNVDLPKYENFFVDLLSTKAKDSDSLTKEEITAVGNIIKELLNDKSIDNIERPINKSHIEKVCKLVQSAGTSLSSKMKVAKGEKITDSISIENLSGKILSWNNIVDMMSSLKTLVDSSKYKYDNDCKTVIENTYTDLRSAGFRIKSAKKMLILEDSSLSSLIPEIKEITVK